MQKYSVCEVHINYAFTLHKVQLFVFVGFINQIRVRSFIVSKTNNIVSVHFKPWKLSLYLPRDMEAGELLHTSIPLIHPYVVNQPPTSLWPIHFKCVILH